MDNSTPPKTGIPVLNEQHIEFLRTRAISLDVALAHNVRSIDLGRLGRHVRKKGIEFPFPGLPLLPVTGIFFGYPVALDGIRRCRVRSDVTSLPADEEGGTVISEGREVPRYLAQAGVPVIPYITQPAMAARNDTSIPVFIVEAPAKALSLVSAGHAAIGLGGVLAGGHDSDALSSLRQLVAHPELRRLRWAGRRVNIAFDAGLCDDDDHPGNPAVAQGAAFVAKSLGDLGADVWLVKIPYHHVQDSEPETGKWWRASDQGPDDFIFRQGVEAFEKLVADAVPADPVRRMRDALANLSKEDRPLVAGRLLRDLFFASTLAVGGDTVIAAVAAVSKSAGVGTRSLAKSASDFRQRSRARRPESSPEWTSKLTTFSSGVPRSTRENIELCLRHDETLVDLVAFDEFHQTLTFKRTPPWVDRYRASASTTSGSPWTDGDDLRLAAYLTEKFGLLDIDPRKIQAAVLLVGLDNPVHPVRDFLTQLAWDGTSRVESWLTDYFGVAPSAYTASVGKWWLISAVERILSPGCKADYTLVLEGPQGIGKSRALRVLGGPWYSDGNLGDLGSKEAAMMLAGTWIREWPEGAIFSRASTRAVKEFSTVQEDEYTPKYSNRKVKVARSCVFALTTNDVEYLADSTGNRRWWPVLCTKVDLDGLGAIREQLFAEAVVLLRRGVTAYPSTAEEKAMCEAAQGERQVSDPWDEVIAEELETIEEKITISDILSRVLNIEVGRQEQKQRLRVTDSLRRLGWELRRSHGARHWVRGPRARPFLRRRDDDGQVVGPFVV